MAANVTVRARVEGHVKNEATRVLADMGLTVSDAIRLLLNRVAREKALPFSVKVPNAVTREAMSEARNGELPSFRSAEEMIAALNASD